MSLSSSSLIEDDINKVVLKEDSILSNSDIIFLDKLIWNHIKNHDLDKDDCLDCVMLSKFIYNDKNNNKKFDKKLISNRLKTIKKYRKKLLGLKRLPLIKQRTPEWFELRKNRLTASDLYDAIKKSNLSLIKKKAGIIVDDTNFNEIPPLKWGTMFEEMATRCYSQRHDDILINEFGLIPDKKLQHFGASPDGISELGIMIEIKCPYSRQIKDGFIPPKYYSQIQGQLAVCELNECDYIECNFKSFKTDEEYFLEINKDEIKDHGIIAEFKISNSNEYYYLYSLENLKPNEAYDYITKNVSLELTNNNTLTFIKLTPWKLEQINIQRVYFNENEWIEISPKIDIFWEKVESSRGLPIEYKKKAEVQKFNFINDE